jgi:hypothetical protein
MHRNKTRRYSVTSSARASSVGGTSMHSPNETLWNVDATMTAYSALMLAARITLAHFSVSSAAQGWTLNWAVKTGS